MRVALTGGDGFVGRWLAAELVEAGHELVGASPGPDVTDGAALGAWVAGAAPDAIVHLAAVSSARRAADDPTRALAVNVGGTIGVIEAAAALRTPPVVLIPSSSEVYGAPDRLPIDEATPLRPGSVYALSKAAQEAAARTLGADRGVPVVVVRSFNHTGPGQTTEFVVPALAARIADVAAGRATTVTTGNLDVKRDLLDVRDVVAAYRLLVEGAREGRVAPGTVVNVASGRAVSIRSVLDRLAELAGVRPVVVTDPALVRAVDPAEIRGDAGRLHALTGWAPRRLLDETLGDVLAAAREAASPGEPGSAPVASRT